MKKFVYQVKSYEFVGQEAFGDAWRAAKAKATELHTAIYRLVIKDGSVRQEVFLNAGCFLTTELADPNSVKIW